MAKLLCGKCGKECDTSDVYVCSDCGGFLCSECSRQTDELCPDCFGRMNKLC